MEFLEEFVQDRFVDCNGLSVYIGHIRSSKALILVPAPTFRLNNLTEENIDVVATNLRAGTNHGELKIDMNIQIRLIYPASERHIISFTSGLSYRKESYEEYLKNANFLETNWMDNIVKNNAVGEKVHLNNSNYLIINDCKWNEESMDELYYLMIFKDRKYRSIREIDDVNLLTAAKEDALKLCASAGLSRDDVCLFFHYRPSYFRLHLHILNISKSKAKIGRPGGCILLEDAIRNISVCKDYYKKDLYFIDLDNPKSCNAATTPDSN